MVTYVERGTQTGDFLDIDDVLPPTKDLDSFKLDEKHESVDETDYIKQENGTCCPTRYILCLMATLGLITVYAMRAGVSIAVAAMVNSTSPAGHDDYNRTGEYCKDRSGNSSHNSEENGEFFWDSHTQELILGSFFYGYLITQLPGGLLADRFGGKYIVAFGVTCTCICTLTFPTAARAGVPYAVLTRVVAGFGEGLFIPVVYSIFGKWMPPGERNRMTLFFITGSSFGMIIGQIAGGVLASSTFLGGWPSLFYIFGASGVMWVISWLMFVYDTPAKHPRISLTEKNYIEKCLAVNSQRPKKRIPWRSILTSVPVWAITVVHMTHTFSFFTLLTNLPIYIKHALKYSLTLTGIFSSIPFCTQGLITVVVGPLFDYVTNRKLISPTMGRKILACGGILVYALVMYFVTVVGCNGALSLLLLTLCIAALALSFCGFAANSIDLAPDFAGSITGFYMMVGPISGILGPFVVGIFTTDQEDIRGWANAFYVMCGTAVFGSAFFAIFGSAVEQPWSRDDQHGGKSDEKE